MTVAARISHSIDGPWLQMSPVPAGRVPPGLATPDRYVTVADDDDPRMRIDVYADQSSSTYEDAIVWQQLVVVGYGDFIHVVSLETRDVVTVPLGSYYSSLHPMPEYLLIASGQRLFRMEPDRSIRWRSAEIGIDGVAVESISGHMVMGQGEWHPPGDWRPFALQLSDGRPMG